MARLPWEERQSTHPISGQAKIGRTKTISFLSLDVKPNALGQISFLLKFE